MCFFPVRPGDEWLVECEEDPEIGIMLRADVGPNPNLPPETGWKFLSLEHQSDQVKFVEDPDLKCIAASPNCAIKISLPGQAASVLKECAGLYKASRFTSMGRQVGICFSAVTIITFVSFKRFMRWRRGAPTTTSW